MSGIVFYKTKDIDRIKEFYISKIGMEIWLEQADCIILKHGNMLIGFCSHQETETGGVIGFFYKNTDQVYDMYKKLRLVAQDEPTVNEKYKIYHFFARDPDDRTIEFQTFLRQVPPTTDPQQTQLDF
jgi:catechol 2,3-dioxygenase-like lactoylglutathione lyase family enzyme